MLNTKYQFSFREAYSTSFALIQLLNTLYAYYDQREIVIGIYFNLTNALDTVDNMILPYCTNCVITVCVETC